MYENLDKYLIGIAFKSSRDFIGDRRTLSISIATKKSPIS